MGAAVVGALALLLFLFGRFGGSLLGWASFDNPSSQKIQRVRLTENDIGDVLLPGIWPGAGLKAYREGDLVTVYTNWSDYETTVDGRTTLDAAQTICAQVINDMEAAKGLPLGTLRVEVFASNGSELLAFRGPTFGGPNDKCHN